MAKADKALQIEIFETAEFNLQDVVDALAEYDSKEAIRHIRENVEAELRLLEHETALLRKRFGAGRCECTPRLTCRWCLSKTR